MKKIFNQVVIALFASCALVSATPVLRLSSTTAVATVSQGSNVATQIIQLYNIGDGTLAPQAVSTASWVTATVGSPTSGTACFLSTNGNCIPLTLAFNTTSLAAGTYSGLIEITNPGAVDAPQSIVVSITIASVPTTLTFYAPPGGVAATTTFDTQTPAVTQASTATGGNWLSVQMETTLGATFVPYQVTANAASISTPGTYNGTVVVSGSNAAADNHTINVALDVTTSPIAQVSTPLINVALGSGQTETIPITIGNLGQGSLAVSSATAAANSGSGWLTAVLASGGASVTVTLSTASLSPGVYTGSVVIASNAVNSPTITVPVTMVVTQQTGPQLGIGGVVDNATFQTTLAPGDIGAAFGLGISSQAATNATTLPLPTLLGGTEILVNGTPAPLYFTSTGQLDFQVPYETVDGLASVQVVNNNVPGNLVSMTIQSRAPRIPLLAGNAPIIINFADGSVPVATATQLPSHPANLGDTLIVYAIGLGQTDPIATDGASAASSPLEEIDPPVNVMLGGGFSPSVQITPLFTGLAPGFAGLYQINFTIPQNAPTGDSIPLTLNIQGSSTNVVYIAIQ
jgi:uncharacterized protein (TIGR03437 family)